MARSYSLAVLLLVTAIAAISLACIRLLWLRVDAGAPSAIAMPMMAGAAGGAAFGLGLAIWRGAAWVWCAVAAIGGMIIGAAAGAQLTAPVSWGVVVLAPLVVLGGAALVALNQHRTELRRNLEAHRESTIFGERDAGPHVPL